MATTPFNRPAGVITPSEQNPLTVNWIADLNALQQQFLRDGNIAWSSQASMLLNQYANDVLPSNTIGDLYSNYYNNVFQPSNSQYEKILSSVDKDYKNRIGSAFQSAQDEYWPQWVLRKQIEDLYNNQAVSLANRFSGQQALNAALWVNQWLDPNQVNIANNILWADANDQILKFRQGQLWALDNLTKTYLDYYNKFNDNYGASNDKYVVNTAAQLKQLRDSLTEMSLNQALQKQMMDYQKSLWGWGGWTWGWTPDTTPTMADLLAGAIWKEGAWSWLPVVLQKSLYDAYNSKNKVQGQSWKNALINAVTS